MHQKVNHAWKKCIKKRRWGDPISFFAWKISQIVFLLESQNLFAFAENHTKRKRKTHCFLEEGFLEYVCTIYQCIWYIVGNNGSGWSYTSKGSNLISQRYDALLCLYIWMGCYIRKSRTETLKRWFIYKNLYHWILQKKYHSTLWAKRATFTITVDKSYSKMPQKWSILTSFWKPKACGQTVLPEFE